MNVEIPELPFAPVSTKVCPLCNLELSREDDFGVVRARPDGRNLYCKSCIRKKVTASRQKRRLIRLARQAARQAALDGIVVERKGNVIAAIPAIPTPAEKVFRELQAPLTQKTLHRLTGLSPDGVSEALAELMLVEGTVVRAGWVDGERLYARKEADARRRA